MQETTQYLPYKLGTICSHSTNKSGSNYVDIVCSKQNDTYHRISQPGKICNKCSVIIVNSINSTDECPCCSDQLESLLSHSKICNHKNRTLEEIVIKCLNDQKETHQIPFRQKVCKNCFDKIRVAFTHTTSCFVCDDKENQVFDNIENTITKPSYYYFDHIIKDMKAKNVVDQQIKQQIEHYCLAEPHPEFKTRFQILQKQYGENLPEHHKSKRYHLYPKCPKHRNQFISLCNNCLVSILNLSCCPYGCVHEKKQNKPATKTTPPLITQTGFIYLYPKQAKDYQYFDYFHIRYVQQAGKSQRWEAALKKIKYQGKDNICNKFSLYSSSVQVERLTYFYCGGVSGQDINKMKTNNKAFLVKISENYKNFNVQDLPNLDQSRSSHSTLFYKDYVYVVGGFQKQNLKCLATCEKFNLKSKKWQKMGSLNIPRSKPSIMEFKEYIYVLGGISSNQQIFDTPCERYDMNTDKWQTIDYQGYDLPFLTASTALNKCWGIGQCANLYILGGSNYQFSTYFLQQIVFQDKKFKMNPSEILHRLNYNRAEPAVSLMKTESESQSIAVVFGGLEQHESVLSIDAIRLKNQKKQISPIFVYDDVNVGSYRLLLRDNSQLAYEYMMKKLISQGLLNKQKLTGQNLLKSDANLHLIEKMWYGVGKCVVGFNGR